MLSQSLIEVAVSPSAHPTDRNGALRRLFVEMGWFSAINGQRVAEGEEPYARVIDVPMLTVMEATRPIIKARGATSSLVAAVKAAIAAPVVETAPKPAPVAAKVEVRAPRQSRPAAPNVRPPAPRVAPPAPKAERQPGKGERWCTHCPKRHVFAEAEAHVPGLKELRRQFSDAPPTREQLLAIAGCRGTRQDGWFPLEQTLERIALLADERARYERAEAERVLGVDLARKFFRR